MAIYPAGVVGGQIVLHDGTDNSIPPEHALPKQGVTNASNMTGYIRRYSNVIHVAKRPKRKVVLIWELLKAGYALNSWKTRFFAAGIAYAVSVYMEQQTVSMQQMVAALRKEAGSKLPVKITKSDGEEIVRYIRGFADADSNILLISETSYSLALKIIEVKDIQKLQYSSSNSNGEWIVLRAKWLKKSARRLTFYLGFIGLFFSFHHHAGS